MNGWSHAWVLCQSPCLGLQHDLEDNVVILDNGTVMPALVLSGGGIRILGGWKKKLMLL